MVRHRCHVCPGPLQQPARVHHLPPGAAHEAAGQQEPQRQPAQDGDHHLWRDTGETSGGWWIQIRHGSRCSCSVIWVCCMQVSDWPLQCVLSFLQFLSVKCVYSRTHNQWANKCRRLSWMWSMNNISCFYASYNAFALLHRQYRHVQCVCYI